ncbi:MAG: IgGFc-binding protein [Deltaproteobacteria bacterium]|nr:IgGFc-binding protein [Deltaproteobacteria bacterium]
MKRCGLIGAAVLWTACSPGGTTDPGVDVVDTVPPDDASCTPGETACNGEFARLCRADGSGWQTQYCDPAQGMTCSPTTGLCQGACAPQYLGATYMGCDYYPTISGNDVISDFEFAVAISNTTSNRATVTIDWGALTEPLVFDVLPGAVVTQTLPWVEKLKGCWGGQATLCPDRAWPVPTLAPKGSYHLRTTQPVTVYQFSPLDYHQTEGRDEIFSYTNDASLLFPVNAMGTEYFVAAWPVMPSPGGIETGSPSEMAITAVADGTHVTITSRAEADGGPLAPALEIGLPVEATLQQGDVLAYFSYTGDFTGTRVESDKPVQVIGGHYCTYIPFGTGYCDHLEESMIPLSSLSTRYAVSPPAVTSMPDGKIRYVRIIATADDTTVSYDPPQAAATHLVRAGDFIELPATTATFVVDANKKIVVAQYMEGQDAGGGMGDPAMALAVPIDQFRLSYLFHAPTNYEVNYVEVFGAVDAEIVLDGDPIGALAGIGDSGIGHRRIVLDDGPRADGNHEIQADQEFGISVYGYGQYTSYWYPGGLDLDQIILE